MIVGGPGNAAVGAGPWRGEAVIPGIVAVFRGTDANLEIVCVEAIPTGRQRVGASPVAEQRVAVGAGGLPRIAVAATGTLRVSMAATGADRVAADAGGCEV